MPSTNFYITSTTTLLSVVTLPMPESIQWGNERDIVSFNSWSLQHYVWDSGKTGEPFTINGTYHGTGTSNPSNAFRRLDAIVEYGDEITLSNFKDSVLDTTWYIQSYSYSGLAGMPNSVEWSIAFEKA